MGKAERVMKRFGKPTGVPKPKTSTVPVSREQAEIYQNIARNIDSLQAQLNTVAGTILAGHGITAGRSVELIGYPKNPRLRFVRIEVSEGDQAPAPPASPEAEQK